MHLNIFAVVRQMSEWHFYVHLQRRLLVTDIDGGQTVEKRLLFHLLLQIIVMVYSQKIVGVALFGADSCIFLRRRLLVNLQLLSRSVRGYLWHAVRRHKRDVVLTHLVGGRIALQDPRLANLHVSRALITHLIISEVATDVLLRRFLVELELAVNSQSTVTHELILHFCLIIDATLHARIEVAQPLLSFKVLVHLLRWLLVALLMKVCHKDLQPFL